MTADQVTIVVLNWNHGGETIDCLESLRDADLRGARVLVVDNGSRDGSVAAIRGRFPEQRILALPENRGYAGGNNAGIRAALEGGAEGVLLLNNDTRVAPDFLHPLLDAINSMPWAAAVSSAILRMERPEMLDVAYSEVHFEQRDAVQIRGVNALVGHGFDTRREVGVAIGCSLLIRAAALRTVGLLDEAYFAYHEDVDWCLRARRAGYTMLFEPYSRVFHRGSVSTAGLRERPAAGASAGPELPNAEPPPWNPVRAYLGARNLVRLLRAYATLEEKRAFARACAYEIPLQFLAIIMGREGWMTLGRWSYRDMLRYYFHERHPVLERAARSRGGKGAALVLKAVLVPADLLWSFPRDVWRAHRTGRVGQFREYVRGLWDGYWRRRLPLRRLGLR